MKIQITLSNSGGELDNKTIDVGDDDSAEISEQIWDAIDGWILSPGDTIKINETERIFDYESENAEWQRALDGSYRAKP